MKFTLSLCILSLIAPCFAASPQEKEAAQQVIEKFLNGNKINYKLESLDKKEGCDQFETSAKNNTLTIKGSSGIALCRGFYDYIKSHNMGINSWSGNRLDIPPSLPSGDKQVTSPFPHHFYFNVVTYGYSMPYWNWKRWEQEIDWMAFHGIDMPLALVANEAISARVWKKLGLTDEEISEYFVGPAHFPWMRMGNASAIDAPLPMEWHEDQVKLQHQILKKMRALGMKPICPGFAGFVPKSMKRLYPDLNLVETHWAGFNNWMISPDQELFKKIGTMFIEEWEKEFGKNNYYLIDSFNEMEVPFPPKGTKERYDLLTSYGDNVYQAVKAANPDATWVMQGWMFGYQRGIWEPASLEALISKVPDDKMLLLDEAIDYNKDFWKNGYNWDFHKGFYNKPWILGYIPNMGGKSGLTGVLDTYANAHLDALNSKNKGNLVGHGLAPEGIENNEVIYELITDAGWSDKKIDVTQWLNNYSTTRYGATSPEINKAWDDLRKSVYNTLTDHPRYNWQFRPGNVKKGSINTTPEFFSAIESFSQSAQTHKDNPLYQADLIEYTAAYVGGKIEYLIMEIDNAYLYDDLEKATQLEKEFNSLMLKMDTILAQHPTFKLENWLEFARAHGDTPELKDYYEKNARRIVTIWGPPIDDYSARIWSGLIRDYYVPRWNHYFASKKSKQAFDFGSWEKDWVENKKGLSNAQPCDNVVTACQELLNQAKNIKTELPKSEGEIVASWSPENISTEWNEVEWTLPANLMKNLKALRFKYLKGNDQLMIKSITIEMDGKEVCKVTQEGSTGTSDRNNIYFVKIPTDATANNSCKLKAVIKSDNKANSFGNVEAILSKAGPK